MSMSHLFDLTGKTALVTGSSDGLGLAIARGLAAAGAQIVLNGRDKRKLATVAKSFEADGRRTSSAGVRRRRRSVGSRSVRAF